MEEYKQAILAFTALKNLIVLIPAFPILAGLFLLFSGRRNSKMVPQTAFFITLLTAVFTFFVSYKCYDPGLVYGFKWHWFESINFGYKIDGMAAVMLMTINLAALIAAFIGQDYFKKQEGNIGFIFSNMLIFLGGMNGVILSVDTIQFYFFYEMMLIPSYFLIAFYGESENCQKTGLKYFIFTHVGAVFLLLAFLFIYSKYGVTDIDSMRSILSALSLAESKFLFLAVFIGFAFKLAIFPFHTWLPDSYNDAPLPVTIMLAAGMINTGIYGMARFLFLFSNETLLYFSYPLIVMAVITQFYGGFMALAENRIKKIIAYSSISQMGYVLVGFASLASNGITGSVMHALNHGLAKALFFMVAGTVVLVTGKQLITEVSGLGSKYKDLGFYATIAGLALLGAPPLCGFTSEWLIFAGGFSTHFKSMIVLSVLATALTTGYSLYFVKRIFYGECPAGLQTVEIPVKMRIAMGLLTVLIFAVGIYPAFIMQLARGAVSLLSRI